MRRRAAPLWFLLAFGTLALGGAPAMASQLEQVQFYAPALKRVWAYSVYRPDGYDEDHRHLPVLYFLHGSSRIVGDWRQLGVKETADAEIAAGRMPPTVIVVPEMGASWGMDGAEPIETAFFHDLMPQVERSEHVRTDGGGRVIGGISAGGFASLRYALRHPGMFAAAALLSPAIYDALPPENSGARHNPAFGMPEFQPARWLAANYPAQMPGFFRQNQALPLYIGSGDQDRLGIQAHAARLFRRWRRHGQTAELQIVPGDHTYAVWRALFPPAIAWVTKAIRNPPCPAGPAPGPVLEVCD